MQSPTPASLFSGDSTAAQYRLCSVKSDTNLAE